MNRLTDHRIAPLYVPARCTDVLQECDTVLNKTYKCGVKAGFKAYLNRVFENHLERNQDAALWKPVLTMGTLKPCIVEFVETGMQAVRTPEFSSVIKTAFHNDGLFGLMRSNEYQTSALAALAPLNGPTVRAVNAVANDGLLPVTIADDEEEEAAVFGLDELGDEIEVIANEEDCVDDSDEADDA